MRVVFALGGNALLRRGEQPTAEAQRANVEVAARAIAELARAHDVVVTHGNGPQIGLLAMESYALAGASAYPLDVLGAESQGMVGYLVETALRNALGRREVVTLLGQVRVQRADPAYGQPAKPIGPVLDPVVARRLAEQRGWTFAAEGDGMRRVVASPEPLEILELPSIRRLVDGGAVVISAGGGGVPVARQDDGTLQGVEAVVDKDLTAALLAAQLGADRLLMLTDVDAVWERWGDAASRRLRVAAPGDLRRFSFAPGSMGPKVEAASRFVERGHGIAGIGRLQDASAILAGRAGTTVQPGDAALAWW